MQCGSGSETLLIFFFFISHKKKFKEHKYYNNLKCLKWHIITSCRNPAFWASESESWSKIVWKCWIRIWIRKKRIRNNTDGKVHFMYDCNYFIKNRFICRSLYSTMYRTLGLTQGYCKVSLSQFCSWLCKGTDQNKYSAVSLGRNGLFETDTESLRNRQRGSRVVPYQ